MDKIQLPDGSLVSIEQAQSLFNDQYQTFIDDGTLKIVSEEQMSNNIFISPDGSEMTEKQARDLYKKQFQSFVNDGTLKKKGDTPSDGQEEVTESITETETIPGSSDSSQQNDEQPAGFSTANDLRRNRYNRERGLGRQIYESEVEIGTPEAMQKQAEAVKEAATVKVEETEEVEEVDYTAEIDAENEVIIQYRNQIKIHEEETQAYLNDNPNLTGDEKYAWVNRDSEKWTPIYEAVEAADLAKEDLLYAGYKTKALEDSGYLEGIEKYRNITDNIDYEKEGINRNIIPEKQYMLTDEVTGKLKPVKESDVNPELLESIKLYEVASIDVSPNYDDVDLDEGEVSNFDEFLGNIIIKDGSDVADYLKWEKKNTRNETAVYKWMKPLLTNDEGDEFFKQKKYYEKVQSYKASQLNEISNRLDQIKAKINLTSDPKLVKILKNEAKELTKEFLAKAASISTTIKDFPIFKKYTDDADLRRRKAMYEASQDGPVSSGGQGLVELLSTTVNTGAGFSLDFLSAIPAFFDQRISTIGEGDDKFDNKGFLKGLEEMFSDRKVSLDAAIGAVSRPAFFDGKPVTSMGKQYLVDENGTVYDANTNIRMDGIISDEKIKEIQTLSKDVTETVTSWTAGSVTQGGVGVLVNLYALIRTSLKVTKGLGLKGPKGSAIGMGITSFGTGVTSNVEDVRSQLVASGMSEKEAIDIAVNAGQAIATLDGIFSGLAGGNQNLLVGLQGIKDQIKNLAIKKGKDFTVKQLVDKGKTLAKENFKEVVIEEIPVYASTQGINHLVNTHIGNEVLNDKITKAGLMETVVMTVGATSGLGARKLLSGNKRSDLVRLAAANVKDLQPTLDVLIKEGSLTEKEASDAYTEIYNMQSAELKTQGTIKVSENLQPASDLLTQRQNLINQKQGLEGPGKARIDKQIAAVDQQLDALYKKDELDVEAIMNSEKEGTVTVTVTKEEALASLRGKNQEANESGISKVAETEENILKEQERLIKERGNPITPTKEASTENKVPKDRLGEAHTDKRLITPSNPKGEANISNVTSLDKEGVSTATYVNPETGSVDAIISSKDKKNFVGYVRVYENGKPTNKFSAKMESTGGAFKNMITSADATLPDGARVIETTTISEGGLKSFNKSNLDVETDADGNVVTNTTKYSDATKQSVEEKGENAYNPFRTDDKAKAEAEVEKIKKAYPGIEVKIKRQGTKRGKKTYTIDIELPVLIKKGKDAISKPSTKEQVLPDAPTSKEGGKESQVELRQVGKGNVEQVTPDTKIEEGETQTDKPSDTTTKTNAEQVEYNEILELEREQEALEQEMDKEPGFLRSVKGMLNDFKGEKSNKKFQETYDRSEKLSQEINDRRNALYNKNSTPADNLKRQKLFDKSKLAFDTYIKSKENFDKIENPTKKDRAEIDRLSEKFRNESQSLANFTESVILRGIPTKIDTTSDTTTEGDVEQVTQPTSTEEGMSVNKDSETKKESEGVSKLRDALRKSGTTVKRNTAKQISKLGKQIENAKKALSKILPDVEIIMPSSEAEYKRLTGESKNQNSGGTYIDGKIYINPNRASSRVVSHEVFHAVLLSKGMSEAQAKAITERMLSAVKKSASKEILDKIDKFSKRYPEALQSEESIAELVGILASEYDTLPKPSQNIVKKWLDKLAKIFGIKPFTDVEVVDLLNTLASKVESGQEVSAKDVKILKGKDSKQKTEARKSRNQGRDVISKKEAAKTIRYLSKKYGIEGALKDMGIFSSYGQFDRKYLEIKINSETTFDAEGNLTSSIKGTGNISRQTIFHEYLHPFVEILENSNKKLYNEIYNKALEQNKKENFFTDQNAYSENQQKEELVVRYLDRLSKNDKVPTLLQSFLGFISETLFKKKKNNRATLEKLSTKTSVEELYDIFKNYGNLKEDIAPIISRDNLKKDIKFAEELLKLAKQENLPQENIDAYQKDLDILNGVLEDTTQSRKSSSKPTIEEIVSKGKEIGSSDADIREVAQQEGYANKDTNSEIEKYDTKKREAAQKAEKLFVKGGKIAKSLDFLRRWALSARGFLPKSMQIGKEVLTGAVAANAKQAENNLKDLQKYIKKQKKSVQDKLVQDLNSYMRGDADIDTLPAKLRPIAYAMRTHIDSLSMSLVESGAITDIKFDELSPKQKKELIKEFGTEAEARKNYKSQKDNIIDNLGSYLNRSFEVFDNKNYSPSDAVLNAAKEKLREQYAEAAKEKALEENNDVDAVLEEMVDNALEKILSREEGREFLNSSKLGSKNISVLKEKIDIPAEIRALMGEYTDPALNYVRSVNKIAALVANQEFLSEMKKAGEGVFFFNKPTGEYNQLIAPKGSDTYNPLNGMYTTKAIRDTVLNTPGFKINDKTIAFLLNWYYGMVGSVKYAKTILSPATHAKNVIGNLFFMAYNGYANPKVYFAAADVVMSDLRGRDKNNNREKMQEYIRLGIINQSANLGEIRSLLKSKGSLEDLMSKRNKADKTPLKRLKRFFKRTGKIAEDAYQAEDDVFKIISFEMEKKRYSKALFNKTFDKLSSEQQKEVTDRVTEIVKNILPNYSRIGGIGKLMKAVPIAGTFISFQIEAMRTAWNVAQLALSEIQNKKTAAIGAKRIAGITAVTAVKAAILPMFGVVGQAGIEAIKDALGNEDDEDDEDEQKEKDVINNSARDFIHPWAENANVIITKLDNGKFNYINFSASDPHGFVDKAIISAFRGETAAEGMENAFTSLIKPFMTKDILFKSITSIETDYGKEIYNETDTPNELAKKFGDIVYKTFEPGGVTSARKLFKAFEDEDKSLLNEIIGQATGFKVHTVDFEKQLLFKSLDLRKRADKASKDYSKAYYERKKKDISVDDLEKRYDVANDKYKQILKDGVRFYSSSLKLGSSRFKSYKSMYGYKKLSRYEMSYIRNGNIPELKKKKTDKYKLK